jgi:hypothetical protein
MHFPPHVQALVAQLAACIDACIDACIERTAGEMAEKGTWGYGMGDGSAGRSVVRASEPGGPPEAA